MLEAFRKAFKIKDIRKKIGYTFLMLIVIRIGSQLPTPGVNGEYIKNFFAQNTGEAFNLFNAFTGGSFEQMSVFALSITPYITSSIIVQLLTIAIPQLEEMQRDGETGRKKIVAITRYLTVGLALIESGAMAVGFGRQGLLVKYNFVNAAIVVLTLTAGSAFLMWIGERITEKGVGNGETPIFPIQIWKKKRGVNYLPQDKNYDLYKYACKVTARRFFPNFINLDATFNQHPKWREDDPNRYYYECATMGCRTRVFADRHGEDTSVGRGNLSFTTVNIVKIAIESAREAQENLGINFELGKGSEQYMTEKYNKEVKKIFLNKLEKYTDIAARQLYDRYKFQCSAVAKQFPLLMSGLWQGSENLKPNDRVEPVLKHGTLGIGFIGLAECLTVLTGKHHAESEKAQKLGIEIITQMKESCDKYSERYDLNYSVLATPAEGLSGRFTKMDRKEYGTILGVTDKDYYTNSNHVPVWYKCTAEEKAKIEAPYHALTAGGHIFYIELDGDATHNPNSVEAVVDLMDKYNMGYGSINHTRSRCLDCGFENADANLKVCPMCGGENIDTIQRITGYLVGTTSRWNKGKLAELHDRVTHTGK